MLIKYPFDKQAKELIKQSFSESKIFLYPTETLMALGCLIDDKTAIRKIFAIKKRHPSKPLLMISDSWQRVLPWVEKLPPDVINVFESLKTAPLTIALPSQHTIRNFLNPFGKNLAFRVTDNQCCIDLIRISQKPLIATSANIAGESATSSLAKVNVHIKNNTDVIITTNNIKNKNNNIPSTVLEYRPTHTLILVRQGEYLKNEIANQIPENWQLRCQLTPKEAQMLD